MTMPKRFAQKVSCNGICIVPLCDRLLKIYSASVTSSTLSMTENPPRLLVGLGRHIGSLQQVITYRACQEGFSCASPVASVRLREIRHGSLSRRSCLLG